jgi:hypothetical protein
MARIRKALLAAGAAFVTGIAAAAAQKGGLPGWPEVGAALGLAIAAGVAVYKVKNAPVS